MNTEAVGTMILLCRTVQTCTHCAFLQDCCTCFYPGRSNKSSALGSNLSKGIMIAHDVKRSTSNKSMSIGGVNIMKKQVFFGQGSHVRCYISLGFCESGANESGGLSLDSNLRIIQSKSWVQDHRTTSLNTIVL